MALNKNKVIAAAQRFAQRGQFDRAISELRTIVEEDPEDVRVWHRIADLQIRKGSVPQAVATYTRIANFYAERGFFLKGVAVYKQILNADPTLVDAHRKLGELYVKLGLGPEAVSQFQIVVGTCEREGRHQESLELLKKIVELGPEDESNRIRLAEAYARQSENDEAIAQFELTLTQLREKQRLEDYIQVAERLLYLYPDELDVVRALSEVYLERNDAKRALARLQTLFRADPSDPGTLELLARAFSAIGQVAKAISVYRELARIHGEASNGPAQAEAWGRLLALDPDDPEALEATGSVSAGPADTPTVSGGFSTAGLDQPSGQRAGGLLDDVELLLKYSLKEHARERLDKVFELDPYHEGALLKLKALALADERPDEAADALMRLAEGAEQAGDPQKAMSWLGEVIQLRPGDPEAAERMRRVSSGMARELASSAEPAEATDDYDAPNDYDVDLGELDFDASIDAEPVGAGFDLDLGELDASVDEEFAEFMSDGPSAPIAPMSGAVLAPPPPDDDAFGDLLADDPPPADDAFGDLLADEPRPADDAFGDLLADEPPAPLAEDDFGDLLAEEPPAPPAEDDFGGLLADEPPASPAEDDFGDLLADEPPAPPADDDFGGLLADEPPVPDDDAFGDLLADATPTPAAAVLVVDPPPSDDFEGFDLNLDDDPPPPAAASSDDFVDHALGANAGRDSAAEFEAGLTGDANTFDKTPSSDFDAPATADSFVDNLPAQGELPDEDEFADLLLDHAGSDPEPDFGVYHSTDDMRLESPRDRLAPVSGAPSDIDIDIDVSMDMPDLDFDLPAVSEPTPEPVSNELPPPPPPPMRPPPPPSRAVPPPPPPPPAGSIDANDDDLEDIEELDLDEIIELDDDDLVLEDDSVDGSVDDSSADGSVGDSSADGSVDDSSADGSVDDSSADGSVDDSSADGSVDDSSADGSADDSSADGSIDPTAGLEDAATPDGLLDLATGDDPTPVPDLDADDEALPGDDPAADEALGGGADETAEHAVDDLQDADRGEAPSEPISGEPVNPAALDNSADDGLDPDNPGNEPELFSPDEALTPSVADDAFAPGPDADDDAGDIADLGDPEATPHPDVTDRSDALEAGETDALDVPDAPDAETPSADDELVSAGESTAEPGPASTEPAEPARPRARPLPRPPAFGGAASLKLVTGLPSAPKPLSASALSLDARSSPTPPKPAAPRAPAAPLEPAAPRPPAATADDANEGALLQPPPAEPIDDDAEDTIAVNVDTLANMFEDGVPEVSVTDQTEAGDLAQGGPEPLHAPGEPEANLDEELAEIDFLIESDLADDARELARELRISHPNHPGLRARADRLEATANLFEDGEDDFLSGLTDDFDLDFGEVKGAELSDLGDDEADTHFDLGLAFREMGQYKKAISELELAARSLDKRAEAFRIIALCYAEQGAPADAVETLREALDTPDLPLGARAGLQYDLANVYEQLGERDQARAQLKSIVAAGMDDFLDVKARLAALES